MRFEIPYIKDASKTLAENRRINIVAYGCIISILSSCGYILVYSLIDFHLFLPVSIRLIVLVSISVFAFVLNLKAHYNIARWILMLSLLVIIFNITANFLGKQPGIHFYFLLFALLPSLCWSIHSNKHLITFLFLVYITCFIYVEIILDESALQIAFPLDYASHFKISALIFTFFIIGVVIVLFQFQVSESEEKLQLQSKKLSETVQDLITNQNKLTVANGSKDKLFSIIAHDLKNPLNGLMGIAGLLITRQNDLDYEKKMRYLKSMYQSSKQTFELLDNLLNWSQIQTNRIEYKPEKTQLHKLCNNAKQLLSTASEKKNITILNQLSKEKLVFADVQMLQTVFRNLISNAIKFTPQGGTIKIAETKSQEDEIIVCISDNGIGMNDQTKNNLFTIENNVSQPGTEDEKGTGLGLILCKEFIEINKGRIWAESKESEGSKFYFNLPIFDSNMEAALS